MSTLRADDVEWITNDNGELGVKIGNQFFFLYKGRSFVYGEAEHDDGTPIHWRHVFKREFGECAHPINYNNPQFIGTVSLSDSDEWQLMPKSNPPAGGEGKPEPHSDGNGPYSYQTEPSPMPASNLQKMQIDDPAPRSGDSALVEARRLLEDTYDLLREDILLAPSGLRQRIDNWLTEYPEEKP